MHKGHFIFGNASRLLPTLLCSRRVRPAVPCHVDLSRTCAFLCRVEFTRYRLLPSVGLLLQPSSGGAALQHRHMEIFFVSSDSSVHYC